MSKKILKQVELYLKNYGMINKLIVLYLNAIQLQEEPIKLEFIYNILVILSLMILFMVDGL